MEAVTQTARAARRYLSVLLSGDDAARKQLVFSPGRVSSRADVGAGEPARAHSEASGSRPRGFAARAPAEGADAPRVTSRFAAEAARVAGKRKRSETEGAKTSDRANETHSSSSRDARRDGPASWTERGRFRSHRAEPRSILAVGGAKRKRVIGEASSGAHATTTPREDVFNLAAGCGSGGSEAPAATRRRLDLLRSVGVVKTRGGVPSTYNLSTSDSVRENENLGASPTTASGRVRLVVSSSRLPLGRIGAGHFRAGHALASLRGRGRFRAAATDPKVVRAELVDLPPDVAPEANPPPAKTSAAAAAAAPEGAFSFGTASAPAPPSLALGAGSTRRSKSRKGRDDDDDSLLGAALRDFNGAKTSGSSSSALEPKKSGAGDANPAATAFGAPAAKKEDAPAADAAKPAAPAFTFGAAPAPAAAGDGAKSASAENIAAATSTGFTFGAATPPPVAAAPAFTFGAAPGASAPSADAAAPFAFGGAAAPPGGGMSMGAGSSAPAGRRVVRARRPGRR